MKKLSSIIRNTFGYLADVFYPRVCIICLNALVRDEEYICISCLNTLPRTNYHISGKHDLEQRFWGIVPIERVCSFFYFQNEGVRMLIHEIKYRGGKSCAAYIAGCYAAEMMENGFFDDVDLLIPVPLHKRRMKERGYNQSSWIAKGIHEVTSVAIAEDVVERVVYNKTQTKVTKEYRWENVQSIFSLVNKEKIKDKHILLIDDVLTTGATLIECAKELQKEPSVRVSVLTLAAVRT